MASALVIMDESAGALDLEDIRVAIRDSTPFSCSYTAWQRFGVSIPQIKVETSVLLTIQINGDPSYVPEEIRELADDVAPLLAPDSGHRLRRATRRLEIRSATPESAWLVGRSSLLTADATDLDTRAADVRQVLESLADAVQGWVFDCQHGFFWSACERIWINCYRSS
jgi:hypothetical protein